MNDEQYIELINSETNESVEVTIHFEYDVEATEYEGAYVFYQGGASLESVYAEPFTFMGKTYKNDIPAELLPYIDFNSRFLKEKKGGVESAVAVLKDPNEDPTDAISDAKYFIEEYANWLFEEYVVPEIDVPCDHYAETR